MKRGLVFSEVTKGNGITFIAAMFTARFLIRNFSLYSTQFNCADFIIVRFQILYYVLVPSLTIKYLVCSCNE